MQPDAEDDDAERQVDWLGLVAVPLSLLLWWLFLGAPRFWTWW